MPRCTARGDSLLVGGAVFAADILFWTGGVSFLFYSMSVQEPTEWPGQRGCRLMVRLVKDNRLPRFSHLILRLATDKHVRLGFRH